MTPSPLSTSASMERSVDQKSCLHRDGLQSSPPPRSSESERSIAFKRWAQGRCYRCLARDHQVSSCKDSFRCIRCRRPGHRERHCHLRSTSSTPWVNSSSAHPHHPQQTKSWADVVAMPLPSQCRTTLSSSTVTQPPVASLPESLRSEFRQLVLDCLEEVLRPLKEETSTIKLWLARLANHLECAEPHGEYTSFSNMPELFGPCSPVRRSPTPSVLTSLVLECTPSDSLGPEETYMNTTNLVADELGSHIVLPESNEVVDTENCQMMPMEQANEGVTTPSLQEACMSTDFVVREETCATSENSITSEKTLEQAIAAPLDAPTVIEGMLRDIVTPLLDVVTPVEDYVLVEDASDDEEVVSQVTVDPTFLITIEDTAMLSTIEVKAEASQQIEDPPIKATSSSATARMEQDAACASTHPPSPPAVTRRRRFTVPCCCWS